MARDAPRAPLAPTAGAAPHPRHLVDGAGVRRDLVAQFSVSAGPAAAGGGPRLLRSVRGLHLLRLLARSAPRRRPVEPPAGVVTEQQPQWWGWGCVERPGSGSAAHGQRAAESALWERLFAPTVLFALWLGEGPTQTAGSRCPLAVPILPHAIRHAQACLNTLALRPEPVIQNTPRA